MSEHGPESSTTRLVLLSLLRWMDGDGGNCYPSIHSICGATKLSEPCVVKHLSIAEKEGWIKKTIRGNNGSGWNLHLYTPLIPEIALNLVKCDQTNRTKPQNKSHLTSEQIALNQVKSTKPIPNHYQKKKVNQKRKTDWTTRHCPPGYPSRPRTDSQNIEP